jgi:F0F1-type ATP synthase assembly protein I
MTGRDDADDARRPRAGAEVDPRLSDPRVMAWMDANVGELRKYIAGPRLERASLVMGFLIGLAIHVGGYLLKSSVRTEPVGLIADLLYSLGFALWTGVVVVTFVEVIPDAKRRQIRDTLDAYEVAVGTKH